METRTSMRSWRRAVPGLLLLMLIPALTVWAWTWIALPYHRCEHIMGIVLHRQRDLLLSSGGKWAALFLVIVLFVRGALWAYWYLPQAPGDFD